MFLKINITIKCDKMFSLSYVI